MSKTVGRNTDCTTELIAKIAQDIRNGLPRESAARLSGISNKTFYNWINRGLTNESPFVQFLHAIEVAEHELEQDLVNAWLDCSKDKVYVLDGKEVVRKGDWKAAETFLKRRKPKHYSDQTYINIDLGDESVSESDKLTKFSDEIIKQMKVGQLSAESGAIILRTIDERRKLLETMDHEQRIKETEAKLKNLGA